MLPPLTGSFPGSARLQWKFLRCPFDSRQTRSHNRAVILSCTSVASRNDAAPEEAGMAIYRYCFRDGSKGIEETRERNFAHDKQAIDNGAAIIAGQASERLEIWRGARLVQSFGPVSSPDPKSAPR